jgi:hypothetical protein
MVTMTYGSSWIFSFYDNIYIMLNAYKCVGGHMILFMAR